MAGSGASTAEDLPLRKRRFTHFTVILVDHLRNLQRGGRSRLQRPCIHPYQALAKTVENTTRTAGAMDFLARTSPLYEYQGTYSAYDDPSHYLPDTSSSLHCRHYYSRVAYGITTRLSRHKTPIWTTVAKARTSPIKGQDKLRNTATPSHLSRVSSTVLARYECCRNIGIDLPPAPRPLTSQGLATVKHLPKAVRASSVYRVISHAPEG